MSIALSVKTNSNVYVAGSIVRGTITVHVDKRCDNGSPANDLVMQLRGKVTTRVISAGNVMDYSGDPQEVDFLKFDMLLTSFRGMAGPGVHVLPFAVVLPEVLPSTMLERCDDGGSAALSYHVRAKLDRPGLLRLDVRAETIVTVLALPRIDVGILTKIPQSFGPSTKVVKNVVRRSIGSITLAVRFDEPAVCPRGILGLTIVANNDCTAAVLSMDMRIVQFTTWVAHGREGQKKRMIFTKSVPGSELGGLSNAAEKRGNRRNSADFADPTQDDVYSRIGSEDGSAILRYELRVPNKTDTAALLSKNGSQLVYASIRENFSESLDLEEMVGSSSGMALNRQVKVAHALEVQLKTSHGCSCPVWLAPFRVLPVDAPELTMASLRSPQPLDTAPGVAQQVGCTSAVQLGKLGDPEHVRVLDRTVMSA